MIETRLDKFKYLALGGVLTGLTLVFTRFGFLQWLTLVPVGLFLFSEADKDAYRARYIYGYGFFFFFCYYAICFHWFLYLFPLDFISGMTPLAALAVCLAGCVGLSALQAAFGGLAFVVIRLCFRSRLLSERRALRPLCVSAVWAVYEWTQTLGWWGVPWARLPIGQSEYIVGLQTASLFGPYFITFVIVLVNMCLAYVIAEKKTKRLMVCISAAALIFQYGVGTALYLIPTDGEETLTVAAVQGNIPSDEKWTSASRYKTVEVYERLTLLAGEKGADIVVWPETALPYTVTPDNGFGEWCEDVAVRSETTVLVGAYTDNEDGDQYNSIIAVMSNGETHPTVYQKRRLVPFGEFVPLKGLISAVIPPLADLVMSDGDILFGEGARVIALEEGNIGCLICFDSIYEDLTRQSVLEGAELICLSTNDSWFTDSAALRMHNAQAQLRAIESGRWVVRAANTGISSIIDSKGNVLRESAALEEDMLIDDVRLNSRLTLYMLTGNALVYGFIAVIAFLIVVDAFKHKRIFDKILRFFK